MINIKGQADLIVKRILDSAEGGKPEVKVLQDMVVIELSKVFSAGHSQGVADETQRHLENRRANDLVVEP